ncbi:MAG: tetratricopeptide repeat protein [Candidatus Omnitrophota bacterium]|nr:tetratricopeptide repeat protein [Candidatus Omnitrophota bacterium]
MKNKVIILSLLIIFFCQLSSFAANKEEEKFFIASKAFSDGFYEASLSLFKRFIEEFPQSKNGSVAKLYIAKCYYFKEDYSHALGILNEIVNKKEAQEVLDEVCYWLAEGYCKGKSFRDSLAFCDRIIEKYPSSKFIWQAHYLAAIDSQELNQEDRSQDLFKKIISQCKDDKIIEGAYLKLLDYFFRKKNYAQLISLGQEYLKKYPKSNLAAKVYFYLGESFYAEKELEEAVKNYSRALELNNDSSFSDLIYQGLALAFIEKQDNTQAKKNIGAIKDEELRLYSQGVYCLKVKDYAQALENFDALLNKFTQGKFFANTSLNRADALYEMGRLNDSLSVYIYIIDNIKGMQYSDIRDKAHYGLAWCYLKNGEFKKAIDEFKNTLKYTDNNIVKISSQIQIADAYQEAGNYNQALDLYNEILKNNPNTVYDDYIQFQIGIVFLKAKRLEEALFALRNLQKNFPSSKLIPQAQYYLAVGYFSAEAYREAEDLLDDFIVKFAQSELMPRVYYLYGKCFYNEKNYSKALEIFKGIIGKFNDREIEELVYIDIGNCYLSLSSFDNAKKTWEEFLNKFNKSQYAGSVALYLGGLYENEKNYIEAERYYKNVTESYKDSVWAKEAILSLGHLYLFKGDIDKAQETLQKLAQMDTPLSLKAKFYLAKIYTQKNLNADAIKIYDELIGSESTVSKIAILEKAYLLKENGEYPEAVILFKKALTAGMDSPKLRFSLAFALEKVNQNKEAIEEYFKAIYTFSQEKDLSDKDSSDYKIKAYFRIAKIYEKEKKIEAAREIYKKIVGFDSEESKIAKARLEELGKAAK